MKEVISDHGEGSFGGVHGAEARLQEELEES